MGNSHGVVKGGSVASLQDAVKFVAGGSVKVLTAKVDKDFEGGRLPESYTGGSILDTTVHGGAVSVKNYVEGVYSQEKEDLIRSIAESVFKSLKISNAKHAKTAPIGDILKHLSKVVPNPKKNGKFNTSFKTSRSDAIIGMP